MIPKRYKSAHKAKRTTLGEYEYRGFVIFDTGGGRSGLDRQNRHSLSRWRVVRKTGPGFFDREPTRYDAQSFGEAKRRIDEGLRREEVPVMEVA
jgi:hypothetical protein